MQSSASRAFNILASKIHPQLPLTPRESQQLLWLLTTSFRRHLDREHSPSVFNDSQDLPQRDIRIQRTSKRAPSPNRKSAQATASKHIEAILTNPLFAVKPQRRASGTFNIGESQRILKDPLQWFLDHVASGSADISKATICLQMLQKTSTDDSSEKERLRSCPGKQIAAWLWSSNIENSRSFVENLNFVNLCIPLLLQENQDATLWRWFSRPLSTRTNETDLNKIDIFRFRANLLRTMVDSTSVDSGVPNKAFDIFLQAMKLLKAAGPSHIKELYASGILLANHIITRAGTTSISPQLFDQFIQSTRHWTRFGTLVEALLKLYHPSGADARFGLAFLKSAECTPCLEGKSRLWVVQLSLGVARQLLAEESYTDAQWALEFTRDRFPDEVGWQPEPSPERRASHGSSWRNQKKHLKFLDSLAAA